MIISLRKRHLWTWILLVLILPVVFFMTRMTPKYDLVNRTDQPQLFSNVLDEVAENGWSLKLRNQGNMDQIEIQLDQPVPNSLGIVKMRFQEEEFVLGKLSESNNYLFDFESLIDSIGQYQISLWDGRTGAILKETTLEVR